MNVMPDGRVVTEKGDLRYVFKMVRGRATKVLQQYAWVYEVSTDDNIGGHYEWRDVPSIVVEGEDNAATGE